MLDVRNIHKTYEGHELLKGISFSLQTGEIICLLGPSGSGKSTLLRVIAGLEEAESGALFWDGSDITSLPAHLRGFGLMFQDYALFPHRSVAENIAFGLRMQKLPKVEINDRVTQALKRIRMESFASRPVTELSGGEQQRVALARALAPQPRLLMLDEPLGALDHNLRLQLIQELRALLHESAVPVIYVTHDREEAFALADRLLLLHAGQIVQSGTPKDLFDRPANAWVASFLGLGNLLPGQVEALSPLRVQTSLGSLLASGADTFSIAQPCHLLLRPADARLGAPSGQGWLAQVKDAVFLGDYYRLELAVAGLELQVYTTDGARPGTQLEVSWRPEEILCLPG